MRKELIELKCRVNRNDPFLNWECWTALQLAIIYPLQITQEQSFTAIYKNHRWKGKGLPKVNQITKQIIEQAEAYVRASEDDKEKSLEELEVKFGINRYELEVAIYGNGISRVIGQNTQTYD
jgi:hypothetical protein